MTFEPITISLPGVPIGKGRPRFSLKSGAAFSTPKTRHYEAMLRDYARLAMGDRAPCDCAVRVIMVAVFPIPDSWSKKKKATAKFCTTRPDADNILKLCDALNQIVWKDDNQIVTALVKKLYGAKPSLTIGVREHHG